MDSDSDSPIEKSDSEEESKLPSLSELRKIADNNGIMRTSFDGRQLSQSDLYSKLLMLNLLLKNNVKEEHPDLDQFLKDEKHKFDVMFNLSLEQLEPKEIFKKLNENIKDPRFLKMINAVSEDKLKSVIKKYVNTPSILSRYSNFIIYDLALTPMNKDFLQKIHLTDISEFKKIQQLKSYKKGNKESPLLETLRHHLEITNRLLENNKTNSSLKTIKRDIEKRMREDTESINLPKQLNVIFPRKYERLAKFIRTSKDPEIISLKHLYNFLVELEDILSLSDHYQYLLMTRVDDSDDSEEKCISSSTEIVDYLIVQCLHLFKNPDSLNQDEIKAYIKQHQCNIQDFRLGTKHFVIRYNLLMKYYLLMKEMSKIYKMIQSKLASMYLKQYDTLYPNDPYGEKKHNQALNEQLRKLIVYKIFKSFIPPKEKKEYEKEDVKDTETEIKRFSNQKVSETDEIKDLLDLELSKYFSRENVDSLTQELLSEHDKTVDDVLDKLATVVIFLDEKYMKREAYLFNEMLAQGRIKESEIFNFGLEKMLHNLYTSLSNEEIDKLEKKINNYIKQYKDQIIYQILLSKKIKLSTQLTHKVIDIYQKIDVKCENQFTKNNDTVYYIELDGDRFMKDLFEYDIYCFSLRHLVDFNITVNPYTNKPFNDDFIDFLNKFKKVDVSQDIRHMIKILADDFHKKENVSHELSKQIRSLIWSE